MLTSPREAVIKLKARNRRARRYAALEAGRGAARERQLRLLENRGGSWREGDAESMLALL